MAINRNLQFYGFAYGNTPVTLDVKINGQQVFLNTITTIPDSIPEDTYGMVLDQVLFEVNDTDLFPITFSGSYSHSIAVSGGSGILIGPVLCNYRSKFDPISNFPIPGNSFQEIPGNTTSFVNVFNGYPTNSEGTSDPRSSVKINNATQVPPLEVSQGIWCWQVDTGSNLSCNLNVGLGSITV